MVFLSLLRGNYGSPTRLYYKGRIAALCPVRRLSSPSNDGYVCQHPRTPHSYGPYGVPKIYNVTYLCNKPTMSVKIFKLGSKYECLLSPLQ